MSISVRTVMERVGCALLGLPARRRLVLRPTPAGILVSMPSTSCRFGADAEPVTIDAAPTPLLLASPSPDSVAAAARADADSTGGVFSDATSGSGAAAASVRPSDPMRRLRDADKALEIRPAADHAMALLSRLQSDSETVGVLDQEDVEDIYNTMLIELAWRPASWQQVGKHLRALTGGRKRYVNREGRKICVYDIPDPKVDEVLEHYEASLSRIAPRAPVQAAERFVEAA